MFEAFDKEANKQNLEYLVIGGYAAGYWGIARFTADLDFVVCSDSKKVVSTTMSGLGYRLGFLHPKGSFAHYEGPGPRIDFMFVDENTWKQLKTGSSFAEFVPGAKFPVVGPVHLVLMKLHSASQEDRSAWRKDLLDVLNIMDQQSISLRDLEKTGKLEKYEKSGIIEKLKQLQTRT